ncbi:MAG TPA: dihydrodipicolinate synthase family protein [Stellaceae bacterium]|jgi:dihydrodipicolinate synthase/N-acetylneuraminate lyase|nr:dihydrodipicolinate synthase family protein [Stellaceae bacterium]
MSQPEFYTMCATVFAPDGSFNEGEMRRYLRRQIEPRLGVYLGSGGNGETHAMSPDELSRLYAVGVEECQGKVPVHANLPEEHTAEQTIAQARLAIAAGVEALHLYTVEGRHGYRPTEAELIGYFDDVLAAINHPVVIAVNPAMGYIPRPQIIAEICRRHEQITAVRLSAQRDIYLLNVQDALGRAIHCHWQLGSGALDPLALGTSLFAAEANIIPQTFRRFVDLAQAGELAAAGEALGHIRRFNQLVMEWGPCARWIKMAMQIFKLPGWQGGLRKPYLMPPDAVVRDFADRLMRLGIPEMEKMAREAGPFVSG